MERLKKIIIILSIALTIVVISVLILNCSLQKAQEQQYVEEHKADISEDFIKQLGIVKDYQTFFSVEEMLNKYIGKIQRKDSVAIYNLMDTAYILENKLTQDNILNHISDISTYASKVKIRKMYEHKNIENAVYYIECILEKEKNGKEFYFALYTDEENLTYSVELIDKQLYEQKIVEEEGTIEDKQIDRNDYNKIYFKNPTEEEIVTKYFEDFMENVLYYPDYAYTLLYPEYKNKCFNSIEEFKEYIESKRQIFLTYDSTNLKAFGEFENMEEYLIYLNTARTLEIKQYQVERKADYNKYICIDSEGNYYTFYATLPMNYEVVLGNYVIPTDEFIKEYEQSSKEEKVVLNIKRFFLGIDDKNYGYSYSVLSDSFKRNQYPTKEAFVKYVTQNFFEKNEIKYESYKKENNVYIYEIKIKDATGKSLEERRFNVIIKLNEGTDFEMSFGQ